MAYTQLSLLAGCLLAVLAVGQSLNPNRTITDECWFEVEIKDLDGPGQHYRGRFTIGLFGEAAPMTSLNFASITRGYKRGKEVLHYKNTLIHRVIQDFVIQMGDITVGDGSGGKSIFGDKFNDEDFILSHRSPGWVAMANQGPDTNGSQFYILLTKARWLDGKHVVFGKVIRGFNTVETIGDSPTLKGVATPRRKIRIVDCGVNELEKKYELTEDQLDSTEDI